MTERHIQLNDFLWGETGAWKGMKVNASAVIAGFTNRCKRQHSVESSFRGIFQSLHSLSNLT